MNSARVKFNASVTPVASKTPRSMPRTSPEALLLPC